LRTKGVECWHPVYCSRLRGSIQLIARKHHSGISTWNYLTILLKSPIPPVYLPEELVAITALDNNEDLMGGQNVAELRKTVKLSLDLIN
jgi:hypothetical protein